MPRRLTWWTRAQTLAWITTRRLDAVAGTRQSSPPALNQRPGADDVLAAIEDALRRGNAPKASHWLPTYSAALAMLADAEASGLSARDGQFRADDIRRRWPSPYGRAGKHATRGAGGVAPKPWNETIVRVLMLKFMRASRDMTREELKAWAAEQLPQGERHDLNFNDPERWTAYVKRAMDAATTDIRLQREYDNISEDEAVTRTRNVRSWQADGRIADR